jgi:[CysO sulfur-carrier protein]-S-L-cysteine hydrolase
LILKTAEIGLSISIDESLINKLIDIGKKYYPKEFGGFLIGNYTDDFKQLDITDTLLPRKYKATKYLFQRDAVGIDGLLKSFYDEIPKKYYVGEWHTHPDNLPIPSSTDINAINTIINHKDVTIENPVFLIIGYNRTEVELGFYVTFKNKLYRYE